MATIVPNDSAPADFHHLSLANAELDFSSGPVESDDPVTISNAEAHPWVFVEYPEAEDTPEAEVADPIEPLAVDAGLNQNEAVTVDAGDGVDFAVTLAAAPAADAEDKIATDATPAQQEFGAFGADHDEESRN
jgi:hypothetical protein